jgi:uncharacterized tellurite resistance protein B-like protein
MFERLKALLQLGSDANDTMAAEDAVPMAAAMLLLEVALADQKITEPELHVTRRAITTMFHLTDDQVNQLVARAQTQHETAIWMYPFTRAANDALTMDEKCQVIESLWRLSDADSGGEVHEADTIRLIAEKLHVSNQDLMAAKLRAQGAD